jgi:FlaA1/EpsC-like NDP-sugar epimerase
MFRGSSYKNIIVFLIDLIIIVFVSFFGIYLRIGASFLDKPYLINQSLNFTVVTLFIFWLLNIHRGIWRYFNFNYIVDIIKASTASILVFLLISFIDSRLDSFPRSVIIINWFLLILLISLPRILFRSFIDGTFLYLLKPKNTNPIPILIAGICPAVEHFIRELNRLKDGSYKVIGVLDEKSNVGRLINNIPILGTIDELDKVYKSLKLKKIVPTRLLISSELYLGGKLQNIIKLAETLSLPISRIPKLTELTHNPHQALPIQPIAIEDLLKRPQRPLDKELITKLIKGKTVLITGAGGSIGSEITRQVARLSPKKIILLDISEFLLFEIEQECLNYFPTLEKRAILADIKNRKLLLNIFKETKPDIVFHAAALKHVPLLENHKIEAVETNMLGTKNIIDAAISFYCERVVMISTDKAVKPSSFMGATKRFAEQYCQSIDSGSTQISIVRFGNVLGSNGSVVPIFEKQIAKGGPITVTNVDATRYFMTIKEAVGLVIQAAAFNNETTTKIYVLDMGEPIKIFDLANQMIMLAGLKPNIDIKIEVIGLRPGEKLHEILVTEHESLASTSHESIFITNPKCVKFNVISKAIDQIITACKTHNEKECVKIINKVIKN